MQINAQKKLHNLVMHCGNSSRR